MESCPYYRAKRALTSAHVIVTNHALLLTKALHNRGPLPDLRTCFVTIDEAHHLPDTAMAYLQRSASPAATLQWGADVSRLMGLIGREPAPDALQACARSCRLPTLETMGSAADLADQFRGLVLPAMKDAQHEGIEPFQLAHALGGESQPLRQALEACAKAVTDTVKGLQCMQATVKSLATTGLPNAQDAAARKRLDQLIHQGQGLAEAWGLLLAEPTLGRPIARWLEADVTLGVNVRAHHSPLWANADLTQHLWNQAAGAVLCSGTICSGQDFSPYLRATGLDRVTGVSLLDLESPYDFATQARLVLPPMRAVPGDDAYLDEAAKITTDLLSKLPPGKGAVLLYSSWTALDGIFSRLPDALKRCALRQGSMSKGALLSQHRSAVAAGHRSFLMGCASMEEGVDLPGELCELVIVAKIPFRYSQGPLDLARQRWCVQAGMSYFDDVLLPVTVNRLAQSAGRLLRRETDRGAVVVLDRRLVTKRYGGRILRDLPPYPVSHSLADASAFWSGQPHPR